MKKFTKLSVIPALLILWGVSNMLLAQVTTYPYIQSFDGFTQSSPATNCDNDGTVSLSGNWTNIVEISGTRKIDWDVYSGCTGSGGCNIGPNGDVTKQLTGSDGIYLYTEASNCYSDCATGTVESPEFDFSALTSPVLSFYYNLYCVDNFQDMGYMDLRYSIDNKSTWTTVWSVGDSTQTSGVSDINWIQVNYVFSQLAGESSVYFRWVGVTTGNYRSDMGLDQVEVRDISNTTWTGTNSSDWQDAGNWNNGVPTPYSKAIIPAGLSTYPNITADAYCAYLNVGSDSNGDASVLDNENLTISYGGAVNAERYLSAGQYHSFSASVSGEVSGMFLPGPDVYLYENNEATYNYTEIIAIDYNLNPFTGYMIWVSGTNYTFSETGGLNTGIFGTTGNVMRSGAPAPPNDYYGWNLFGNPYTSAIDWDATSGWTKTSIDATIYIYNGTQWATYNSTSGGSNGGKQRIAMGQGFFVHETDAGGAYPEYGTLIMDNNVRVHGDTVGYLKSVINNKVSLQVEGNGYTDETVIIFRDDATAGFESDYDAYKLESQQPGVPTIYSVGSTNFAVNVLPQSDVVELGFKADINATFTISINEINDIGDVLLEDTFTGEITDLNISSYSFDYSTDDNTNRFIVHFTPLGIDVSSNKSIFNIYSFDNNAYVSAPENAQGEIFVYNTMGQMIAVSVITNTLNKIYIKKAGYYIVKVMSDNIVETGKIFIK